MFVQVLMMMIMNVSVVRTSVAHTRRIQKGYKGHKKGDLDVVVVDKMQTHTHNERMTPP